MPVPVNGIIAVPPVEEVLVTVSWPVRAPRAVGSNSTSSVAVCPGVSVTGNAGPDIVKPVPVNTAELTVTDAVPVEDKITVCVADVFNTTFPNPTLVALMLRVDVLAFTVNVTVWVAVV
jgi:hypothetical protein